MAFESQEMGKRILNWEDLPVGVYKVRGFRDNDNLYGASWKIVNGVSRILALERKGERIKVWACYRIIWEMDNIPRNRWTHLKIINNGWKRIKGVETYLTFDCEVIS